MATFGNTATTNAGYTQLGPGCTYAAKLTLPEAGIVTSLSVFAANFVASTRVFRLALYADDGANLMGAFALATVEGSITGSSDYAWRTLTDIDGGTVLAAGDYWAMIWSGDAGADIRFNCSAVGSGDAVWKDGVTYHATNDPPSPMTGEASDPRTFSIYGTYTATPAASSLRVDAVSGVSMTATVRLAPLYFDSEITGLTPGEHYYARAYATNEDGTAYGNEVEFDTGATTYPATETFPAVSGASLAPKVKRAASLNVPCLGGLSLTPKVKRAATLAIDAVGGVSLTATRTQAPAAPYFWVDAQGEATLGIPTVKRAASLSADSSVGLSLTPTVKRAASLSVAAQSTVALAPTAVGHGRRKRVCLADLIIHGRKKVGS